MFNNSTLKKIWQSVWQALSVNDKNSTPPSKRPLKMEPLEERQVLSGVTLITHGAVATPFSSMPVWVSEMSDVVAERIAGGRSDKVAQLLVTVSPRGTEDNALSVSDLQTWNGFNANSIESAIRNSFDGEVIVTIDWSSVAFPSFTTTGTVKDYLFEHLFRSDSQIAELLSENPIHMIGHSRGASLMGAIAEGFGEQGIWVDQVTHLDPHPLLVPADWGENGFGPFRVAENVVFADNYYREGGVLSPNGEFVNGALNLRFRESHFAGGKVGYSDFGGDVHADVHLWYHGTIDNELSFNDGAEHVFVGTRKGETGYWFDPESAYEFINQGEFPQNRDEAGFGISRYGDYSRPRVGTNRQFGGSAPRSYVDQSNAEWANAGYFDVSDHFNSGNENLIQVDPTDGFTLGFYYDNPSSSNSKIEFFLDDDTNMRNGYREIGLGSLTVQPGTKTSYRQIEIDNISSANPLERYYLVAKSTTGGKSRFSYHDVPFQVVRQSHEIQIWAGQNGAVDQDEITKVFHGSDLIINARPDSGFVVKEWYYNDPNQPFQIGGTILEVPRILNDGWVNVVFEKEPDAPSIEIKSPDPGGEYGTGTHLYVVWDADDVAGNLKIELLRNGQVEEVISSSISSRTGKKRYRIPSNMQQDNDYQVRITSLNNGSISSTSSKFSIIEVDSGDGPIPIDTLEELQAVGSNRTIDVGGGNWFNFANDAHYVMTADIRVSEDFTPLSQGDNYFRGIFDGQNHRIVDLEIDVTDSTDSDDWREVGLFAITGEEAVIKNVILDDGYVRGLADVGALVGFNSGLIVNVHSYLEDVDGRPIPGGSKLTYNIGGLVGENEGIIRNSSVRGDATVENEGEGDNTGGIVGKNASTGIIEWAEATLWSVYVTGDRDRSDESGGIAGLNEGIIRESFVHVGARIEAVNNVGGIAGENTGLIENSFAIGKIEDDELGGIVGRNNGQVVNSYAVPKFIGTDKGGLAGNNQNTLNNSFWDASYSGINQAIANGNGQVINCHGETTANMKRKSTFTAAGWDFDHIWTIESGEYPTLRGAGASMIEQPDVSASDDLAGKVRLSWPAVSGADRYNIYRSNAENGNFEFLGNTSQTSFSDQSTTEEVPYYYRVTAAYTQNNAGESDFDHAETVEGKSVFQPDPPSSLSASSDQENHVLITWNEPKSANYYRVYRATSQNGQRTAISDWASSNVFYDTNAELGNTYYYWAKASKYADGSGESEFSEYTTGHVGLPFIQLSQNHLDFDWVLKGALQTKSIRIENTGDSDLIVSAAHTTHPAFMLFPNNQPGAGDDWVLSKGTSKTIQVGFRGESFDEFDEQLVLKTNDPDNREFSIRLIASTSIDFTSLGTVDFRQLKQQRIDEDWYRVTADQEGIVTAIAEFSNSNGDIDLELFDADFNLVATSEGGVNVERVDIDGARSGDQFFVRILGKNSQVDLSFVNLVRIDDDQILVNATRQGAEFESATQSLAINGVAYSFEGEPISLFEFHGKGGRDVINIIGSKANEVGHVYPDRLQFSDNEFDVVALNVEDKFIHGMGGQNSAYFYDTSGDELFRSYKNRAILTGKGFANEVRGFSETTGYSTTGKDMARMFDSNGNDLYRTYGRAVIMSGDGFTNWARNFARTAGYSRNGSDQAVMYDSPTDDMYRTYSDKAVMTGDGFFNWAGGFGETKGISRNGSDIARIFDSVGNDIYTAHHDRVEMAGDQYVNTAVGFHKNNAYSDSGQDVAHLYDSTGIDFYRAYHDRVSMIGEGFANRAYGFDQSYGYSTSGKDIARFYDSVGNDIYRSYSNRVVMTGNNFSNWAGGFFRTIAYASHGNDFAQMSDSSGNDNLKAEANSLNFVLANTRQWIHGFETVEANSANGGIDKASAKNLNFELNLIGPWK